MKPQNPSAIKTISRIATGVQGLALKWPSLLVFVRHGESEGNKFGRHHMSKVKKIPTHKYALTPTGRLHAVKAGEYINRTFGAHSFDAYFTSTYLRAQETLYHMFKKYSKKGKSITPIIDARVNEIYRGWVSIHGIGEMRERYPEDVQSFEQNGWYHNIPLGGQSCAQVEHIIQGFLAYIREACSGKRVIVVGHGTWINLCCRILMNRTIDESHTQHQSHYFKNGSITVFETNASGTLMQTAEAYVPYSEQLEVTQCD